MITQLCIYQLLIILSLTLAKDDDIQLPPCPRHLEYMPQELPMHCRMPRNTDSETFGMPDMSNYPTLPPDFPFFQSPSPDKLPPPLPIPMPPFPGMSPGIQAPIPPGIQQGVPQGMPPSMLPGMPPGMQLPMPPGMRIMPGMPGPIPLPMPVPIPAGPAHKLPVIVMPFYSPDLRSYPKPPRHQRHPSKRRPHKKRPNRYNSSEVDTDSSSSDDVSDSNESDDIGWWKGKGHKKKKGHKKYGIYRRFNRHHNIKKKKKKADLLTPILQYVTKDGYVIFEKKITKSEANDWLGPKEEAKVKEEESAAKKYADIDEPAHKVEIEAEEAVEDETPKTKTKESSSVEVNEMNESPQTEKPRLKHKKKKKQYDIKDMRL